MQQPNKIYFCPYRCTYQYSISIGSPQLNKTYFTSGTKYPDINLAEFYSQVHYRIALKHKTYSIA